MKLILFVCLVAGSVNIVPACGDKFLVTSRGTRFQHAPGSHGPSSILIYASPASEVSRVLSGVQVEAPLRKAGYRPTTVQSPAEFNEVLTRGGWDLVVVSLAEAGTVSLRAPKSGVLPVAVSLPEGELKQTRRLYPVVLHGQVKIQAFLDAVDEALAAQSKSNSQSKKRS